MVQKQPLVLFSCKRVVTGVPKEVAKLEGYMMGAGMISSLVIAGIALWAAIYQIHKGRKSLIILSELTFRAVHLMICRIEHVDQETLIRLEDEITERVQEIFPPKLWADLEQGLRMAGEGRKKDE